MSNEIYCDGCRDNLSSSGNSIDYRLSLSVERIAPHEGPVTDVMRYRPIGQDCHFCGLKCLRNWLDSKTTAKE
jgi:hypothetical protein